MARVGLILRKVLAVSYLLAMLTVLAWFIAMAVKDFQYDWWVMLRAVMMMLGFSVLSLSMLAVAVFAANQLVD